MPFIILIFISAFGIEIIATYVSIIGLASFLGQSTVIIAMAIALDVAKITTVSFLYSYWKDIKIIMKMYMTVAALVLMLITSVGVFGYLSGAFQTAMLPTKGADIELVALTKEGEKLSARKIEIDAQIAQLPTNYVNRRIRLMESFKEETGFINARLKEIDKKMPELQIANVNIQAHVGPIIYVATAFDISVEEAIKYIILSIIFVFDPLAILLIISGNFLIAKRKAEMPRNNPIIPEIIVADIPTPKPPTKPTTKISGTLVTLDSVFPYAPITPEKKSKAKASAKTETKTPKVDVAPITEDLIEPDFKSLTDEDLNTLLDETISENNIEETQVTEPALIETIDDIRSHLDSITDEEIQKTKIKFQHEGSTHWRPSEEKNNFQKL